LVWYLDQPEYFQYPADASIDENVQLIYGGFSELPGYTAVRQNGLYIGIEDPDLCIHVYYLLSLADFNPLTAELNLICHLPALLAHHILHVSRKRVNQT